MTKFATALTILLVASVASGAPEFNFPWDMSTIVEAQWNKLMEMQQNLKEAFTPAKDLSEALIEKIKRAKEVATTGFEESVKNLASGYENVRSCTSASTNFTQTSATILDETNICAEGVYAKLSTDYENAVSSAKNLANQLKEFLDQTKDCEGHWFGRALCTIQVGFLHIGDIIDVSSDLIADAASLIGAYAHAAGDLRKCGFETAIKVIAKDGEKTYVAIEACLDNLNSDTTATTA